MEESLENVRDVSELIDHLQDVGKTIHSQLLSLEDPENESVSIMDIGNALS
jgi:hypothetical protein